MRTKQQWGTVIYDKTRKRYRARYQNPHKPGAVVQRMFKDKLTAQGWLAGEQRLVEGEKAGLAAWTHPSERDAEQREQQQRKAVMFRDYATSYVEQARRKDGMPFAPATRRKHREYLAHLLKAGFAGKAVSAVTTADIHRWLETPMDPTPRLRAWQLLKEIMTQAQRTGIIEHSPVTMKAPRLPKSRQAQIPVATRAQLKIIYDNMPAYSRIAVYMGACFDLRINEVCALQVRDFDLTRGVLHVRHSVGRGEDDTGLRRLKDTKTASSTADLPIPTPLRRMIIDQINGRNPEAMFIASPVTGGIISDAAIRRQFNRAAAVAGREDLHFHTLRATAIDTATHQGATLKETMALGRHDDEKTSIERYQRANHQRLQELTDAVATALLPQQRTAEQIRREIRQTKRHLERLEHELAEIVEQARKEDGTPSS